jgi:hypothetical protein
MKFLLFFVPLLTFGQPSMYLDFGVGNAAQLGYATPTLDFSATLEHYSTHLVLLTAGRWSPTGKVAYGKVTNVSFQETSLLRLGRRMVVGPGLKVSRVIFHDLQDSAVSWTPQAVVGYDDERTWRVLARWNFPGVDRRYHMQGGSVVVQYWKGPLRFGLTVSREAFFPKSLPSTRFVGWSFVESVGVRFGGRQK